MVAYPASGSLIWDTGLKAYLDAEVPALGSHNVYTGQQDINGGGFTKPYDTDHWIAGAPRTAPSGPTQAIYTQHRITGDAGAAVHDSIAAEIRLNGISNATFLNALEASVVVTGGVNTIPSARAITANLSFSGSPTGTITASSLIRSQTVGALPVGMAITTLYGLYVEAQTVGGTNYSVYAPTGRSHLGILETEGDLTVGSAGTGTRTLNLSGAVGTTMNFAFQTGGVDRWHIRRDSTAETGSNAGSNLVLIARDDTGANIGNVVTFTRATRAIKLDTGPLGFYGATPASKPTITGSKGSNAALTSLLTALATLGLLTDSST